MNFVFNLEKVYFNFLLILIMFPWVSFRLNDLDTQPFFSFFSFFSFYFIIKNNFFIKKHQNLFVFAFLFYLLVSIVLIFLSIFQFNYGFSLFGLIRELTNYFVLFFLPVFLIYFISRKHNFINKLLFFNYIWLIAGLLQVLIDVNIFDFLVNVRTSEGRGVTGLAPEPSFFGFFLLFLNLIYLKFFDYTLPRPYILLFSLNVIGILFLAQSSITIVYLMILFIFYIIYNLSIKYLIIFLFSTFFIIETIIGLDTNVRVFQLVNKVLDVGIHNIIFVDSSIYSRVMSIVFPYYFTLKNLLLPNGIFVFSELSNNNCINYINNILCYERTHDKIMSFYGSIFFQLGFLTFFYIFYYFKPILKAKKINIFEFLFLFLLLQSAITLSFTTLSILISILWMVKENASEKNINN